MYSWMCSSFERVVRQAAADRGQKQPAAYFEYSIESVLNNFAIQVRPL